MTKKTILVVDDSPSIPLTFSKIFIKKEYLAETALSGFEALEKFKTGDIDLVLTDLKMEGMDGIELIQTIKKLQPTIPVILMTGLLNYDVEVSRAKLEITVMSKPINLEYLLEKIETLLADRG